MTAAETIPAHLKKYIVEQNYGRYTPEDQAVWRYILRQLKNFLSEHAHSAYVEGLEKTGIQIDEIPSIAHMDQRLREFGWRAVPVSGFIPPAAFMEFQSLGILPIASDMRSLDHLTYTPAPDIVHEAAGHAPMLILPEYARYLKSYADVARNAILTKEDLQQYEAIRILSDIKENPESTDQDILAAERRLDQVNRQMPAVSEAGWLSRMNWWTAEYGLVGTIKDPKIFGAGLLSSVGESKHCLNPKVKKIPLTVECIETGYDITEPQPQLFVTENFSQLHDVLDLLAEKMAFRLGGRVGLERALNARTVNTVELDSGLQISGQLDAVEHESHRPVFLKFSGPVALATHRQQLPGHGTQMHSNGFSSPLGLFNGRSLSRASDSELNEAGLAAGRKTNLKFDSGFEVSGVVRSWTRVDRKVVMIHFTDCTVKRGEKIYFHPDWGTFDLAVGEAVVSVFGGPADRTAYGESADFVAARVPQRKLAPEVQKRYDFYLRLRQLRKLKPSDVERSWRLLAEECKRTYFNNWLMVIELAEVLTVNNLTSCKQDLDDLIRHLKDSAQSQAVLDCIQDGIQLAGRNL